VLNFALMALYNRILWPAHTPPASKQEIYRAQYH